MCSFFPPSRHTSLSAEKGTDLPPSFCRACPFLASDLRACDESASIIPHSIFNRTNNLLSLSFRELTLPTASLILTI